VEAASYEKVALAVTPFTTTGAAVAVAAVIAAGVVRLSAAAAGAMHDTALVLALTTTHGLPPMVMVLADFKVEKPMPLKVTLVPPARDPVEKEDDRKRQYNEEEGLERRRLEADVNWCRVDRSNHNKRK
jgi:hypothetical protein